MKNLIFVLAIIFSIPSFAGGYYYPGINNYDPITGYYYKGVSSEEAPGFLSSKGKSVVNLYIFDPKSDKGRYLFTNREKFEVLTIVFEIGIEGGKVIFQTDYSAAIKNNLDIPLRPLKSNMLIVTRDTESLEKTFYFANKDGSNLAEVKSISPSDEWHVDVKNSVIRIIRQKGKEIKIESFKW